MQKRKVYQKFLISEAGVIHGSAFRSLARDANLVLDEADDAVDAYLNNWRRYDDFHPYLKFSQRSYIDSIGGEELLLGLSPLAHAIQSRHFEAKTTAPKVLFISHEASLTGAPSVLLDIIKEANQKGWRSQCVIGGRHLERIDQFKAETEILHLPGEDDLIPAIADFMSEYPDIVYANTVLSAPILEAILNCIPVERQTPLVVSHVHELANVQRHFAAETAFLCENSDIIIAVSDKCAESLRQALLTNKPLIRVIPPFRACTAPVVEEQADQLVSRSSSEAGADQQVRVFGCGTIEHRKGFDLFCQTASILRSSSVFKANPVKFVWIGKSSVDTEPFTSVEAWGVADIVEHVGLHDNPASLYRKGDIFLLPSREDPFPLVCIEAASCELPVVCFDGRAGGMSTFVREGSCGMIAEYLNCDDLAKCIEHLLEDRGMCEAQGVNGKAHAQNYHPHKVLPQIFDIVTDGLSRLNQKAKGIQIADAGRKSVTVVSFSPPPVNELTIAEGGGLRSWGLARSIKLARKDWTVKLVFPSWYVDDPRAADKGYDISLGIHEPTGVELAVWSDCDALVEQCLTTQVVVIRFCHGQYTQQIMSALRPDQTLVLDCYVPIYPEVCARRSKQSIEEYRHYMSDCKDWNSTLVRGDILLCANEQQRHFYYGILFSSGKINPVNYSSYDRLIVAPYGVDKVATAHPQVAELMVRPSNGARQEPFTVLWFGGVYPWFNIEDLVHACAIINDSVMPCRLLIAGALNPFNNHPLFKATAERLVRLCEHEAFRDIVELIDWMPYNKRGLIYERCDLVVALNQPGIENNFAWRTRIIDYLQHSLVFATNGGDPISEALIEIGLGFRISASSVETLASELGGLATSFSSGSIASQIDQNKLEALQEQLSWEVIGNNLCAKIEQVVV